MAARNHRPTCRNSTRLSFSMFRASSVAETFGYRPTAAPSADSAKAASAGLSESDEAIRAPSDTELEGLLVAPHVPRERIVATMATVPTRIFVYLIAGIISLVPEISSIQPHYRTITYCRYRTTVLGNRCGSVQNNYPDIRLSSQELFRFATNGKI